MSHTRLDREPCLCDVCLKARDAEIARVRSAGNVPRERLKIVPSPRLDWCSACGKEHGYDCPLDTPQEERDGTGMDAYKVPQNLQNDEKSVGLGDKATNLPQEEPWVAESLDELVRDLCSVVPRSKSEVRRRLTNLLEADRKERAGVVVERVAKMFDKDALKESGDTMGTVALYSHSRGWNNAIKKIVKIIKDVMK